MIKNIFSKSLILAAAITAVACSQNYLDTVPQSATSPDIIFETTDAAALAVNGISKMMTTQYLGTQGMNGEGTIMSWYGNFTGNDLQKCNQTGWASLWNCTYMERSTSSYDYYPWFYYYKLIGNANQIIANIDDAAGSESEKNFIKAQALTFRAYSFLMLSQLYCHRWVDSNNGADPGIVLRLDTSTGDFPLSTLAATYEEIYKDLTDAINLFDNSTEERAGYYAPDRSVACAVYARAALTREDWTTAATYAAEARKGYTLMSSDEYMNSGFSVPNKEWIWGVYEAQDQTLYYYGFYAYQGSNSSSSNCRSYPTAISKELYDLIPATDARRNLWLEPTADEYADKKLDKTTGKSTGLLYKRAFQDYPTKLYSTSTVFMYMQFKFQGQYQPGGGPINIFRAAEMYLTEAEALCHSANPDYAKIQGLLNELNRNHDPSYNCTKTGDELLEEVKLYRRIDLWGEGFDWFDYKRWKQPIVRKSIANGGSWHSTFAITLNPTDANNWTWVIPNKETDYNDAI